MPVPRPRGGRRGAGAWTATVLLAAAALAGCSANAESGFTDDTTGNQTPEKQVSQARLKVNLPMRGPVSVDKLVHISVQHGTLRNVRFAAGKHKVPGQLSKDEASWTATDRLEPGTAYHLSGTAGRPDGISQKGNPPVHPIKLALHPPNFPSN